MQAKHFTLGFIMSLAPQLGLAQSNTPQPTTFISPTGDTLLLEKDLPSHDDVVAVLNPPGSPIQAQYALVTQADLGPTEIGARYKKEVYLRSEDLRLTSSDILGTSTVFRGNGYELDFYETQMNGQPELWISISTPDILRADADAAHNPFCSNLSPDGVKAAIEAGGAPALVNIVKNLQAGIK